jgi:predicted ribosome quality control (RQC) complex YloA/Tae2 family protein
MIITKQLIINNNIFNIQIGKDAIGNQTLIQASYPKDVWFHFENESSPHIVLEHSDKIDKKVLRQVGFELFQYKKSKGNVIYTEIKNVKCILPIGTVTTRKTKVLKYF